MRIYIGVFVIFTTMWLNSLPSHGQNLADIARKERARRGGMKHASRVYTNSDLVKYQEHLIDGEPAREFKPSQSLERVASETQTGRSEAEEECAWSQRFLAARRQLLEAEIQERKLQAKIRELNARATWLSSSVFAMVVVPFGSLDVYQELEESNKSILILKKALEDLREQLRKSGRPQSWEDSLAALMGCSESRESDSPGARDQQYWQKQVALIESYYDSLVSPLEAELSGDREPGNTYVPDIGLLIKELRQRHEEEKRAVAELAVRKGALPGWFR